MRQLIFKLFFTLLGGVFILYFVIPWSYFGLNVPFSGTPYKLGLDLQWGIELDYQIDLSQAELEEDYDATRKKAIIEWLKSVIDKRVEALNINDSIITWASYAGEEHIIVQIPLKGNSSFENSENIEKAKAAIGKVVKIEFKEERESISGADIEERKKSIDQFYTEISQGNYAFLVDAQRLSDSFENTSYGTVADISQEFTFSQEISLDLGLSKSVISTVNKQWIEWYVIYNIGKDAHNYIFFSKDPSAWKSAQDREGRVLDDRYFIKASVQYNEAFQPMVELTFNDDGADIFGDLTKRLIGEPIAIFVWGQLLTAPTVNDTILSGRAVITGNYTPEEATILAQDINTWVVPAPIYLTSERTIDSRLGLNSLEKIIIAGLIGFVMILAFLIYVYRFAWLIAAIALFTYVAIILAILKYAGIVLTLASIAWLVLSIGIAIDANILIFERIKDEIKKGKNLEKSVTMGFDKSFSAIWDANITGLIVAIILFVFWINLIKWFGLILAIGIIVSLFSVFFISRIFIKILSTTNIGFEKFIWYKK